jgi:hypothetical protein
MSGLIELIRGWILSNNQVKCVECGQYYKQMGDGDMSPSDKSLNGNKTEIINVCGEACFSTYISKNKEAIK